MSTPHCPPISPISPLSPLTSCLQALNACLESFIQPGGVGAKAGGQSTGMGMEGWVGWGIKINGVQSCYPFQQSPPLSPAHKIILESTRRSLQPINTPIRAATRAASTATLAPHAARRLRPAGQGAQLLRSAAKGLT